MKPAAVRRRALVTVSTLLTFAVVGVLLLVCILVLFGDTETLSNGREIIEAQLTPAGAHVVSPYDVADEFYDLPRGVLTEPPTTATPAPNWVNNHRRVIYNSPSVIPPQTLRNLMDVDFIKSIGRPRRLYGQQRFPAADAVFNELLNMTLVRETAAAAAAATRSSSPSQSTGGAEHGGSPHVSVLYAVSKAKAMYTSLRGLIADTVDDRVELSYYEGFLTRLRPPGISRFVLLELIGADRSDSAMGKEGANATAGSQAPAVALLPLLRDLLASYGTVRPLTIVGTGGGDSSPDEFWGPFVKSPTLRDELMGAIGRQAGGRSCGAAFVPDTESMAAVPLITAAIELKVNIPNATQALKEADKQADAIKWSYLQGVASPLHEMLRVRACGSRSDDADEEARAVGTANCEQEKRLASVIHGSSRARAAFIGKERKRPASGEGAPEDAALADPRAVTQIARAMRPLVDVQVISSFDALYNRLADIELRTGRGEGVSGNPGDDAEADNRMGYPSVRPDLRSHFFIGERFYGTQAEFEAFLLYLFANAREATYVELPNLFACHAFQRGGERGPHSGTKAAASTGYNLTERLLEWYVNPLLAGRTRHEKSADGTYNGDFIIGKGPHAKPESKNRRVTSMVRLLEAIVASYGMFAHMTLIFEEPVAGFCSPGSVAAVAVGEQHGHGMPRVVVRYSPDRLRLQKERKKEPLLERADCHVWPV